MLKKFLIRLWKDERGFFQFALPLITAGLGALGGGKKTTEQTSTESGSENQFQSIMNQMSPEQQQLFSMLIQNFQQLQGSDPGVNLSNFDRERTAGLNSINQSFQASREGALADTAGRGLSFSNPALTSIAAQRGFKSQAEGALEGDIGRRRSEQEFQLPFLIENLRQQRQQLGQSLFASLPFNQTRESNRDFNSTRTGTATTPSNRLGGAISGFGAGVALGGVPEFANLSNGSGTFKINRPGEGNISNPFASFGNSQR